MSLNAVRAALVAILLLAVSASAVLALDTPPNLTSGVTDQANVLSASEERAVQAALDQLRADKDVQLFVAYVDTTGGANVNDFTAATADASSLGGNDALILVAIDDRTYSMWVGDSLDEITDTEIDEILTGSLESALVDGDYAGAMVASAEAVGAAMSGSIVETPAAATTRPASPAPTTSSGGTGTGTGSSGGGLNIVPILAFLVIIGGLFLIVRTVLMRRRHTTVQTAALDTLNSEANRALLAADEALKDAANDVEFAAAQWGDAEVVPYRDAIQQANDELRAAFGLRQKLDDAYPEKPPERDAMLREIVARCTKAGQLLDAQEERFDQLRDLEEAAPAQLATLPPLVEALKARRTTAEAIASRLRSTYAPSATASINGNLEEAAKAIDAATVEATRGAEVVASKPSDGVVALRRSQEAMARATQLVEAVERLGASLDDAAGRLTTELDAAARDVEAARGAVSGLAQAPQLPPAAGAPATDPAAALRAAEVALGEARRAADARPLDPLAALQRAVAANEAADAIVAQVADVTTAIVRRRQGAETAVATAQGHVDRAIDYITTRRHGVGEAARTRAAEAEVRLEEARTLVASNPEGATATANRATQLADEAYRLAAGEFEGWSTETGPVAGPYRPGGGGDGGEIVGAVIGGILGAVISGAVNSGRGHGSGWGGSPWGGSSGGSMTGGFGIPTGLPRSGGGGGGRSRGGGFSMPSGGGGGGGGRVRGGRW